VQGYVSEAEGWIEDRTGRAEYSSIAVAGNFVGQKKVPAGAGQAGLLGNNVQKQHEVSSTWSQEQNSAGLGNKSNRTGKRIENRVNTDMGRKTGDDNRGRESQYRRMRPPGGTFLTAHPGVSGTANHRRVCHQLSTRCESFYNKTCGDIRHSFFAQNLRKEEVHFCCRPVKLALHHVYQ
jgi:hypothetical protein